MRDIHVAQNVNPGVPVMHPIVEGRVPTTLMGVILGESHVATEVLVFVVFVAYPQFDNYCLCESTPHQKLYLIPKK